LQVTPQTAATHVALALAGAGQTLPQPPQLAVSDEVSRHVPAQGANGQRNAEQHAEGQTSRHDPPRQARAPTSLHGGPKSC
jgi:hypothetical protein